MPFNFEIDGDWDDKTQAYDKKTPKPLKLDDSGPPPEETLPRQLANMSEDSLPQPSVTDDVRIKQLEAVTQHVLAKLRALEERLGLGKEP